ncbi:alpha/beta hydrolase [Mesorhizobium sp. PUT5]|uniref:alpha/beta hydrolase n=1 Tax=Mesorhizobium sp. PUT5 TaxID=3454629 RepID=UPI003FA47E2D
MSGVGAALGILFFAAALTPTLVPRSYLTQGILAGSCLAAGYGMGVLCRRVWAYLELPEPGGKLRRVANMVILACCIGVAIVFLRQATEWQNAVRMAMGMEPVESVHPLKLSVIALVTFSVLLAIARLFGLAARLSTGRMQSFLPRRVATLAGLALTAVLFWSLGNNLLANTVFRVLDSSYREYDALIEPERPQPTDANKTGSAASLIRWNELGRAGREFIASAPTAEEIGSFTRQPAKEPVRVYVGLRAADTAEARAGLALEELKRAGGFERKILIVITPTGTGWVDPAAMDPVEYLHHGDTASVAVQYSYLSSPLSLLVQPEYGSETARALFREIYRYWTGLPRDRRPKLYLQGLSLGAMNSEKSMDLFEMIGDPVDGALWSGPPFASRIWRSVTDARNAGSPEWLPEYRDGRLFRFMNQAGGTVPPGSPWGPMRIVYLQYASDPIVFFDYRDLYRRPAWLEAPRGPDVSSELKWYPVVTMLQLALDMAVATGTPMGYGHVYAPEHYVDAWVAVAGADGWSPAAIESLKAYLAARARAPAGATDQAYDGRGG